MSMFEASVNSRAAAPEDGTYAAVCYLLADIGTRETTFGEKRQMVVGFVLPGENNFCAYKTYSIYMDDDGKISMSTKSTLYKDIRAWRGKDFTPEERAQFSIAKLVGAPCLIQLTAGTSKDGKTYSNITAITRLPKEMAKPECPLTQIIYSIADSPVEDVAKLPVWIGNRVKETAEFENRCAADRETEAYKQRAKESMAATYAKQTQAVAAAAVQSAASSVHSDPGFDDADLPF